VNDAARDNQSFLENALQKSVMLRALRIACVLGVVPSLMNYGHRIPADTADASTVLEVALTFLVPYRVSTCSYVPAVRERLQALHPVQPQRIVWDIAQSYPTLAPCSILQTFGENTALYIDLSESGHTGPYGPRQKRRGQFDRQETSSRQFVCHDPAGNEPE